MNPILATIVFAGACLAEAAEGVSEDSASQPDVVLHDTMPSVVEAVEAGILQWRETLTFSGNYHHRMGAGLTLEDALAGRFVDPETEKPLAAVHPKDTESADGFLAKSPDAFRWSYRRINALRSRGRIRINPSFDLVAGHGVVARYVFPAAGVGGSVTVTRSSGSGFLDRFPCRGIPIAPFFAVSTGKENLFASAKESPEHRRWGYRRIASDKLLVVVDRTAAVPVGESASQLTIQCHYVIRTNSRLPLVESIATYLTQDGAKRELVTKTEFSDFVRLKDGTEVSRRVACAVMKRSSSVRPGESLWISRIWHCSNLDTNVPSDRAFVLTVPEGTTVKGLRASSTTRFDISAIRPEDVIASGNDVIRQGNESRPFVTPLSASRMIRYRILGSFFLVLGLIVLAIWYRRRGRPGL